MGVLAVFFFGCAVLFSASSSACSWSASSQFDSRHSARRADINTRETAEKAGAWAAATNNLDQWLMRDLGEVKVVKGVITKGRDYSPDWPHGPHDQYVTSYVISYGVENGDEKFYTNAENEIIVFAGNSDRDGEVRHDFRDYSGPDALMARFIKIHPRTWHEHISMRLKIVQGYTERSGTCYKYKFFAESMTYDAAAKTCAADGGRLAVVKSQDLQNFLFIRILGVDSDTDYWIGLRQMAGGWTWSDGTAVYSGFTNWAPGEPNSHCEKCGQLWHAQGFKWDDTNCDYQKPFICEIDDCTITTQIASTDGSGTGHGTCGVPAISPNRNRVVGGKDAIHGNWPWQVSMLRQGGHKCGGSIIAPNWIVTAAHCVVRNRSPRQWTIRVGSHRRQNTDSTQRDHAVSRVIMHERYNYRSFDNDIALMKLSSSIRFDDYASPVCLPTVDAADGTMCYSTGWGSTGGTGGPNILQQGKVPIVDRSTCKSGSYYNGRITSNMICAGYRQGGVDACEGDSGGPLVCEYSGKWTLDGIVSWGVGCARPYKPGVYTRVINYISWINNKMASD